MSVFGTVSGYQTLFMGRKIAKYKSLKEILFRNVDNVTVTPTKNVSYHVLQRVIPTKLDCMEDCRLPGSGAQVLHIEGFAR